MHELHHVYIKIDLLGIFKAFCQNKKLNVNHFFLKSELKSIFIFLICFEIPNLLANDISISFIIYDFISEYSGLYYLDLPFGMVIFSTPHFLIHGIMNQLLSPQTRQIFLLKNCLFRLSPYVQTTR